jgi:large subunit ribosomal protein L18
MKRTRLQSLKRRHRRVRKNVRGVADKPRLCVYRSLKHLYAQIVDDASGSTLCAVTTNTKETKADGRKSFCNKSFAKQMGEKLGKLAQDKGIKQVVFDRGGLLYHGCVKELADGVRSTGVKF